MLPWRNLLRRTYWSYSMELSPQNRRSGSAACPSCNSGLFRITLWLPPASRPLPRNPHLPQISLLRARRDTGSTTLPSPDIPGNKQQTSRSMLLPHLPSPLRSSQSSHIPRPVHRMALWKATVRTLSWQPHFPRPEALHEHLQNPVLQDNHIRSGFSP